MGRIEQHLEWCARRNLRPNYITEVRSTLRRLDKLFGPLEDTTEDQVEAWWATLNVGPGARIAYAAHLSGFYRWLIYSRLRNDDPTSRLIRPRVRRGIPRPIDDASLYRALGAAGQPVRSWLVLAAYEGFRACEIAPLCREDIRTDLGVIFVRDGKGGKQRTLPIHPLVAACLEYGPTSGPLFRRRKTGPAVIVAWSIVDQGKADPPSVGDIVYISAGGSDVGAGITRTAFSEAVKAANAKDRVGFNLLVASGKIFLIDNCSGGRLIDTAFGGERQVRLDSGEAVWVDSSWLKHSAADCA